MTRELFVRFALAMGLLLGTSAPGLAEPCTNEFNAWNQYFNPASQAEARSLSEEERYHLGTQGFRNRDDIQVRLGPIKNWENDPASLRVAAAMLLAARSDLQTMAQYRYGACLALAKAARLERGSSRAALRPAPTIGPKPAPIVVAEKLPKARPAKEQLWSPKSMPTYGSNTLDPKYTAERSDILVSCSAAIRQLGVAAGAPPEDASLVFESKWLSDKDMAKGADRISEMSANNESWIATGKGNATTQATQLVGRCALQRRLAQLQGSPLIAGAIDGTLTPLSIGTSNLPGPPGKDAHIIASNGKSAMTCVKLVRLANGDSKLTGIGGRVLSNQCSDAVEAGWCYSPGDCDSESGSSWTIRPGRSWPIKSAGDVRWAACHGANTQSFVKGSHGLRYYCTAPK